MSIIVRDAIIRLAIEQVGDTIEAPDLQPAITEVNNYSAATERAAESISQASADIAEAQIRAAEGFKTAGMGAFTAARGIALFAASGEEDLREMLETLAKIQGAFDVFAGTVDVVKGLREGYTALSAAQAATTATTVGLTTATTSLTAALAPIGLGLGAALAVGILLWKDWGEAAQSAADLAEESIIRTRRNLEDQNAEFAEFAALQDKIRGVQSPAERVASIRGELGQLGAPVSPVALREEAGLLQLRGSLFAAMNEAAAAAREMEELREAGQWVTPAGERKVAALERVEELEPQVMAAEKKLAGMLGMEAERQERREKLQAELFRAEQELARERQREIEDQQRAAQRRLEDIRRMRAQSELALGIRTADDPRRQLADTMRAEPEATAALERISQALEAMADANEARSNAFIENAREQAATAARLSAAQREARRAIEDRALED